MERKVEKLYYDFKQFIEKNYNFGKMGKIGLTFNTPCPNYPPCSFCNASSFIPHTNRVITPIKEQISSGIPYLSKKYKTKNFIGYFQDNTSTYGDIEVLKRGYEDATSFDKIKILNISTRPDYIDKEILKAITLSSNRKPVWIELGIQTFNENTLKNIDRGHDLTTFYKAYNLIRKMTNFKVGLHLIIGLPEENEDDFYSTAREVSRIRPDYIKISHLQIVKGSKLEKVYQKGEIEVLDLNSYIDILGNYLGYISEDISIHRVIGSAHIDQLIAPFWKVKHGDFFEKLYSSMKEKGIKQGSLLI
ncbi:MAG: TIGR01212 family radical SAM protein [Candidatus Cloacimonadota bacterium]|nr:MAG: TIGR01212 family radical SAM protein [Candidatus Cloacimonadota bacterium]PIE78248.1 MAG: TIGR01212 family radical SAM protein [Candidatus Delongbacteria bacterium]